MSIGIDIIEIDRIRAVLRRHGKRFLARIFTQAEQEYCMGHSDPAGPLAARFAAKEAVAKALGVGIGHEISWLDLEIARSVRGQPTLPRYPEIALSITHSRDYAAAVALCRG